MRAGQRPIFVHGDRLVVTAANTDDTARHGQRPSRASRGRRHYARRPGISKWRRKTNRLWIDGPGRMTMPIAQDLDGQPLARPQSFAVTWQGGMNFQANTVVFQQTVDAAAEHQLLATEQARGGLQPGD